LTYDTLKKDKKFALSSVNHNNQTINIEEVLARFYPSLSSPGDILDTNALKERDDSECVTDINYNLVGKKVIIIDNESRTGGRIIDYDSKTKNHIVAVGDRDGNERVVKNINFATEKSKYEIKFFVTF
jgi:hypothetical protein